MIPFACKITPVDGSERQLYVRPVERSRDTFKGIDPWRRDLLAKVARENAAQVQVAQKATNSRTHMSDRGPLESLSRCDEEAVNLRQRKLPQLICFPLEPKVGKQAQQPTLMFRDARRSQRAVITEERQVVTENGGAGSRGAPARPPSLLPEVLDQPPTSTTVVFGNDRLPPLGRRGSTCLR